MGREGASDLHLSVGAPPALRLNGRLVKLQLPPLTWPATFRVDDRGFFSGPQMAIQLDLLDRATGQLLWSKAVTDDADPMDAKAVAKLLDDAFAGQSWARRSR